MKCSSRRNCDAADIPAIASAVAASMKCSS